MEFTLLIKKLKGQELSPEEEIAFNNWYAESEKHRTYFENIKKNYGKEVRPIDLEKSWNKIAAKTYRKTYYRYAVGAVVIVMLGIIFFVNYDNNPTAPSTESNTLQATDSIQTGTDKAILTLEDGSKVELSRTNPYRSASASSNGKQLVYKNEKPTDVEVKYNTLTIPTGGQFYIVLSDGTKVWLNSETQLKYPVTFAPNLPRTVELLYGEAFFEVTSKNEAEAFLVKTKGLTTKVLGTSFNIKSYDEDTVITTTLVEGKIRLADGRQTTDLLPDQQAVLNLGSKTITVATVDVYAEIAWKEGVFSFKQKPLKDILKVLARWYDIDVEFVKTDKENITFTGVFNKKQPITNILTIIKNTNEVTIKTKGKKVVIE